MLERLPRQPLGRAARRLCDQILRAPVSLAAGVVIALSLFFLAFPGVDLWVSRAFYVPGQGFIAVRDHLLVVFRNSIDLLVMVAAVVMLAGLAVKLARPQRPSPIPPNRVLFLFSSLILGPGLLVNVILKDHWGRPRPSMIAAFGGSSPYVPVWEISHFCSRNCSFVAGEPSAAAWLVGAALLLPGGWRLVGMIMAGTYAIFISLNRIAFGGHFLSDVLLSVALTFLVMALLHRLLVERPPAALANPILEANLTTVGRRLKGAERPAAGTR